MNIDLDRLRRDLIYYFGSATPIYPVAITDIIEVENADYDRLIEIANSNSFDLSKYIIEPYTRSLLK